MDKQSAVKLIRETFEQPFERESFVNLSKNLLKHLDESNNFVWGGNRLPNAGAFQTYINSIERIGKYEDTDGNKMDVLIVRLKKEQSLEYARTMQRNFVARYLDGFMNSEQKNAALVAFTSQESSDWRFSLVKMDYNLAKTAAGKVKVEKELTPARRYSFLVGEHESSHTAQMQLLDILLDDIRKPLLSDFEKAFSIEVVTKEFFTKYKDLYLDIEESLRKLIQRDDKVRSEFTSCGMDTVGFAKKLLGQIVFLYFLQKKGWFGVGRDAAWGTGPKDFLRRLFEKKNASYSNFFNDILEPLFYEALAIERTDDFYSRFNCKIPFLNGGLFDPINNYDWVHVDIPLPNGLFSNTEKTKEGDTGTGILDVFDRYNFTVKEDEPLEKEVAIDPEMLGKVFENMLDVKDRKSKGTYYTPREIVHYMCQESLINYLDTALNSGEVALAQEKPANLKLFGAPAFQQQALKTSGNINRVFRQDIEDFIRLGELVTENDITAIKKQTEIEQGNIKSSKYQIILRSIQEHAQEIDDALANVRVCDPAIGSGAFPVGLMTEIVRARNTLTKYLPDKTGRTNYHFKRHAIQNCLYGVDIDSGAVEIAKLRLWLSLVVDEEDIKQIQPLPNLDYKIVCGNSLLGVKKDVLNWPLFEELEKLKPIHFNETNNKKKQEYKNQIDQLILKLTNNKEIFDFEVYFSEVFHKKGGFDIVIANPPYIDSELMVKEQPVLRQKYSELYSSAKGNWDLYVLFLELGHMLLNSTGTASFITPNKWFAIGYGKEIRKLLGKNIFRIANCNSVKVFEAGNSPVITIFANNCRTNEIVVDRFDNDYSISHSLSIKKQFLEDNLGLSLADCLSTVLRIRNQPKTIGDYYIAENPFSVAEAYEIDSILMDLSSYKDSNGPYFRFINTGTIEPFLSLWGKKKTTYLKAKYNNPIVNKVTFKKLFPKRYEQMIKPKIIISGIRHFESFLDEDGQYIAGKSTEIVFTKNGLSLKVALGILNSRLIGFYIKQSYSVLGIGGGINFTIDMIKSLPTPRLDTVDIQQSIILLIDRILAFTKDSDFFSNPIKQAKVKEYESQIDQLVYELYGLTTEEITIVEGERIG